MFDPSLIAAGIDNVSEPERLCRPRMRVIIDNDFSGDPDDLFELVHHVLSPSLDIRAIIGSHLSVEDEWDPSAQQATNAVRVARETLAIMGLDQRFRVVQGSNLGLLDRRTPRVSAAADTIIHEAMREDTDLPLFVLCGAGLTDVASAYLQNPAIAGRLTVIWIGGPEYADLAVPSPGAMPLEYNLGIDVTAAQVVFNDSDLDLWHVPRNVYRQCLMSLSELVRRVRPFGDIGAHLFRNVERILRWRPEIGETYVMGDQPLVTLTALQSSFQPDSSSSGYQWRPCPLIDELGQYAPAPEEARVIRVYTDVDARLTFDDFFAKLSAFAG